MPHDLTKLGSASQSATAPPPRTTPHASALPARKWFTRLAIPVGLLLAVAGLLLAVSWEKLLPATPVQVAPVVVKAATSQQQIGGIVSQAPGWLEPDPHATYVSALTNGVVESVLVLEGDKVDAGQPVAQMITEDAALTLRRAKAELAQAISHRAIAQVQLQTATELLTELVDRTQAIETATATVQETKAERASLDAAIAAQQALVDAAQDEYDRKAKLVGETVSKGEVARLRLQLKAAEASLQAITARTPAFDAKIAHAQAIYKATKRHNTLLIEERFDVATAQAKIELANASVALATTTRDEAALHLDRTTVRAATSGVVLRLLVSPGSKLMLDMDSPHSAHVVHLYKPSELRARVDVPLADAASINLDQEADIIVDALPDEVFKGRVTRIVHEADIQKNTIEVKVSLLDSSPILKPEMLARVKFRAAVQASSNTPTLRNRLFAPESAIRMAEGIATAIVVTNRSGDYGRAESRTLTLGTVQRDGWREITEGLRPGDLLVVNPPPSIQHGDRVRFTETPSTTATPSTANTATVAPQRTTEVPSYATH